MKQVVFLFSVCCQLSLFAQIVTNGSEPAKKKSKTRDSLSVLYMDFQRLNTSPHLSQNIDFLTVPLGERAKETSLKVWSYQLGLTAPITKHLAFDGGLAWIQNGEQYKWESTVTDSSYSYTTKYRYFGMPIQLKYQTGKDFVFFVGAGLTPQLFQSLHQSVHWTDSLGNATDQTYNDGSICQSFSLSALASTGIQVHFQSNYGLKLSVYYRYQLTNAYGPYENFKYYSTGIGGGIALTRKF